MSAPIFGATFSPEFKNEFKAKARTEREKQIVDRILSLSVTTDEAKTIMMRVPFISSRDRLNLLRLLEEERTRQFERVKTSETALESGYLEVGDVAERLNILKKYLYSLVSTEDQYHQVQKMLDQSATISEIEVSLQNLAFIKERDRELAFKILQGRLEANFETVREEQTLYAQRFEMASVSTKGNATDLMQVKSSTARIRHEVVTRSEFKGKDMEAEISLLAGASSLRPDEDVTLERLRLKTKGQHFQFNLGQPDTLELSRALNQPYFGTQYIHFYPGSIPLEAEVFFGVVEEDLSTLLQNQQFYSALGGMRLTKRKSDEEDFGLVYVTASESERLEGRNSRVLSLISNSNLARDMTLRSEVSFSSGTKRNAKNSEGAFLSLDGQYDDGTLDSRIYVSGSSDDYFSLMGDSTANLTEIYGNVGKNESWGRWQLHALMRESQITDTESADGLLRPGMNLHFSRPFGWRDFFVDYRYLQSTEESKDRLKLLGADNHALQFTRQISRYQLETILEHRSEKDINLSSRNEITNTVRVNARGHWTTKQHQFSPEVYVISESKNPVFSPALDRQGTGFKISGDITPKTKGSIDYSSWNQDKTLSSPSQKQRKLQGNLVHPLSADWKRTLDLSAHVERLNLNSGANDGENQQIQLTYNRDF